MRPYPIIAGALALVLSTCCNKIIKEESGCGINKRTYANGMIEYRDHDSWFYYDYPENGPSLDAFQASLADVQTQVFDALKRGEAQEAMKRARKDYKRGSKEFEPWIVEKYDVAVARLASCSER